jgi:hypothetical protein
MAIDALVDSLGMTGDPDSFSSWLEAQGTVAVPDLDEDDPDQHHDWVLIRRKGLELGFADAAYFAGKPRDFWRSEGLVFNQLTFYSDTREGVRPYTGELPHGLLMTDSRATVRAKLAAFEATRHSYLTDRWDTERYRLIVAYRSDGQGLDSVHLKLNAAPLDERQRQQPPVAAEAWLQLFGLPAASPALGQALAPLDIPARIEEHEDDREVDFLGECGLSLYFEKASKLKTAAKSRGSGLVLGAVKFYRARDLEARQYTGGLPFGLQFDDSPEALVARVGAEPARRTDGKLTGRALWHFEHCSLQVLYSTVENHLFRVMLMAPGYWQELSAPD